MNKEKLIIICVAILAVGIVWSQLAKQDSIEKQVEMKIDQENKVLELEREKEKKATEIENSNKLLINMCINEAEDSYWNYLELNGTGKRDKGVTAPNYIWDTAKEDKKDAIDLCYKKFN